MGARELCHIRARPFRLIRLEAPLRVGRARTMARIKGINLTHTQSFVETTFGAEGWATVLASLTKETRAAIESVVAVGWYKAHLHVDLLRAIDETPGGGDRSVPNRRWGHDRTFGRS